MKVIDVSYHNGDIDFNKVKASGVEGVIIRAGFGWEYTRDKMAETNIRKCIEAGLPFGLYVYSYATNMKEAKHEVQEFINHIVAYKPELPVFIDTEDADGWRKNHGNPSFKEIAEMVKYQLLLLEKAGFYAGYYCSTSWYDAMKKYADLEPHDLWQADWRSGIKPYENAGIWQYTAVGKVDGINGNVDMNICYKDYPNIIRNAGLNGFKKSTIEKGENKKDKAKGLIKELSNTIDEI